VLIPFDITFLQTITFILVIASLVQMVEIILKKISPPLYQALGIFLPLITTNCAILGVAILAQSQELNLVESVVFALANAVGFGLAMLLFAGLREHLDIMEVPKGMRGVPVALVTAGILALAFLGFSGLV
jgi:electron transport complex protein RnfA